MNAPRFATSAICFVFLVIAPFCGAAGPAAAIGTYKDWDHMSVTGTLGCGAGTNFGQVISVPKGKHILNAFSFTWRAYSVPQAMALPSMVIRGEVYSWEGEKATGHSLYEAAPRKIALRGGFHKESFRLPAWH